MPVLDSAHFEFTGFMIVTILFLAAGGVLVASNRTVSQNARNVFLGSTIALSLIVAIDWFDYALLAALALGCFILALNAVNHARD